MKLGLALLSEAHLWLLLAAVEQKCARYLYTG